LQLVVEDLRNSAGRGQNTQHKTHIAKLQPDESSKNKGNDPNPILSSSGSEPQNLQKREKDMKELCALTANNLTDEDEKLLSGIRGEGWASAFRLAPLADRMKIAAARIVQLLYGKEGEKKYDAYRRYRRENPEAKDPSQIFARGQQFAQAYQNSKTRWQEAVVTEKGKESSDEKIKSEEEMATSMPQQDKVKEADSDPKLQPDESSKNKGNDSNPILSSSESEAQNLQKREEEITTSMPQQGNVEEVDESENDRIKIGGNSDSNIGTKNIPVAEDPDADQNSSIPVAEPLDVEGEIDENYNAIPIPNLFAPQH
jgi:hypothetical protein